MPTNRYAQCLHQASKNIKEQHLLAPYSTFGIGGPADYFVSPKNEHELQSIFSCIVQHKVPFVILGGGSNILVADEGFRGTVVHPVLTHIHREKQHVNVGSGFGLQRFLQYLRDEGLSGLEHLAGIPGSVGGALAGNAGTSQKWIDASVVEIHSINTKTAKKKNFSRDECSFTYRKSIFKESSEWCISQGVFKFTQSTTKEVGDRMALQMKKRNKQPTGNKSAGCVFKNPPEAPAGKLIDELGLKGKSIGKIKISNDHGNFMVNMGGGKATDVIKLISYVKQQVRDKRGIQLQEEVRYIGF